MKTIKKIRFVSFITMCLTHFVSNVNTVNALNSREMYSNASAFTKFIYAFLLLSALFSASVFIYTSVYILVKE